MSELDNQQTTTSWIAAFIEGEGDFTRNTDRDLTLKITNTNLDLIHVCEDFLRKNFVMFTHQIPKKLEGLKQQYRILIHGQDCRNLYWILESKLECRRREFQWCVGVPETVRDTSPDVQWLVGIWQAEGWFSLIRRVGNTKDGLRLSPCIATGNTNYRIIEKIVKTIRLLGCSWTSFDLQVEGYKLFKRITLRSNSLLRFLRAMNGLWHGERDKARTALLKEYLQSRADGASRAPYTSRQWEIYWQLKALNKRGDDTVRSASETCSDEQK